jgi:Gas vesicle synthesis protein GvpL/GvpF
VYGVVPANEAAPGLFAGLAAIGDAAPTLIEQEGLAAIVSRAPLADFDAEAFAGKVKNPEWLEANVRAHEGVLEAAVGRVPVVPFRFGTIYRSPDQVRQMLADHRELQDELARVAGKVELGVKGFLLAEAAGGGGDEPAASSGRQYLERKQAARRVAEEADALRTRYANDAHERLAAVAEEAVANPLQTREVSGAAGDMFLNGAYLVAEDRRSAFGKAVAGLQASHRDSSVTYEVTGPWPPYNFVGRIDE